MSEVVAKVFGGPDALKQPATAIEAEQELQRKVFVSNLPHDATEFELEEFFEQAGIIQKVIIVTKNNDATGYGFATYSEIADLSEAIKKLNKLSFKGRQLRIEPALPKKELILSRRNRQRNRGAKHPSNKHSKNREEKIDWADDVEDQNIADLVKRGPPPPIKGRRFPLSSSHHKLKGEASTNTLFVGNLGLDINENKFVEIFKDLNIEKAWLVRREYPPFMVKGFGFLQLNSEEELKKALESSSTRTHNGRQLQMRTAILPKSDTTPTKQVNKKVSQEIPTEASWPPLNSTKLPNGISSDNVEDEKEKEKEANNSEVKEEPQVNEKELEGISVEEVKTVEKSI